MGFPLMVYRSGTVLADYRIVDDEDEKAEAREAGYLPLDMVAFMARKTHADVAKPEQAAAVERPRRRGGR